MYEIVVTDRQQILPLDVERIRRVAERTLQDEQVVSAQISLAFVDDREIHRINREFLQHDYPTDVVSFLLECRESAEGNSSNSRSPRGRGKSIAGEVIVSTETAVAAARDLVWSPADETLLYVIHGLLHLAGYDDLTEDERQIMRTREREVLSGWGLSPADGGDADEPPPPSADRERSSALDGEAP
jgi:probable rRNA maturation factor